MILSFPPPHLQTIRHPILEQKKIHLSVLRTDLIDENIQGNKWYKLKYFLEDAQKKSYKAILSFGGAFSNHIFASAAAAHRLGWASVGIIRGEQNLPLNPVLEFAQKQGMQIVYCDRNTYRQKNKSEFIAQLQEKFIDYYFIPEGGYADLGAAGARHILDQVPYFDVLVAAAGTGTTAAGLLQAAPEESQKIFFSVLKGNFMEQNIQALLPKNYPNWQVGQAHFGGYAKVKPFIFDFMKDFYRYTQIPLDAIYTAKLFFALFEQIKNDEFKSQTRILAIHSGGVNPLYKNFFSENL